MPSVGALSISTSRCSQSDAGGETDLRLPGADISRVHAEISIENGTCVIRDKQSRFGTFVNGEKYSERVLAHGDQIRLGQAGDTEIVFFIDDEAPSVEKSAVSAASELRQMAALLEGLRALGSGRVPRRSAGDGARLRHRGHRRRARLHHDGEPRAAARVQARPGARQGDALRPHVSRPAARFRKPCSPPASRPSSRTCSTAISRSCTPARSPSASAMSSARRCAWCATSSGPSRRARTRSSACCISTAASAAPYAPPTPTPRSTHCRPKRRSPSRTRACIARRSTRRSSSRSSGSPRRFSSRCCRSRAAKARFSPPRPRRSPAARSEATSTTTWTCRPTSSASSSATWRERDRRPRCSRRRCSACSAPKPPIRRAPRR